MPLQLTVGVRTANVLGTKLKCRRTIAGRAYHFMTDQSASMASTCASVPTGTSIR